MLPTAHAEKLHRDGSTEPPTVNLRHAAASRVVSSRAMRAQPREGDCESSAAWMAAAVLWPHELRQTRFQM